MVAQLLQRRCPAADVGDLVEEPVAVLRLDPGCQVLGELDDAPQVLGAQILTWAEHDPPRVDALAQQAGDCALHRDALAGPARAHEEIERAQHHVAQRMRVVGGERVQPRLPQIGIPLLPTPRVLPPRVEVEQVLTALKIPHMLATIAQSEKSLTITRPILDRSLNRTKPI